MIYQNFKAILIAVTLCVISVSASAKQYKCSLKVNQVVEKFQFDVVKDQKGIAGNFNDYVYFMSVKNNRISIKIQNSKTASQVRSEYEMTNDLIEISQTPGWEFLCSVNLDVPSVIKTPIPNILKLDEETPLEKFKADISFTIVSSMKVRYNVSKANARMRSIVFQKGRLYTADDDVKRDLNGNWCLLQVQLELDQDTIIKEGNNWQTARYKTLKNSSSHVVYSYSFIDPAQGKISQKFKRYAPFNLVCQVKKGEVFNQKMWRQVTGDRIKLYYNPKY